MQPVRPPMVIGANSPVGGKTMDAPEQTPQRDEVGAAAGAGQVRIAGLMGDDLFYLLHDFKTRTSAVMALNLTTGAARALYRHNAAMADAVVAPDRQRIAFTTGEGGGTVGVYVVSLRRH